MQIIKSFFSFLLAVGCWHCGYSQDAADSLLKKMTGAKEDSNKVLLLIKIGEVYEINEPTKARFYYRQAEKLGNQLGFYPGLLKTFAGYKTTFQTEGNTDSAFYYIEKSLSLARKTKDSLQIGIALFNLGILYRDKSEFEKALAYCLEGRVILEIKGGLSILAKVNDALQGLYYYRTEYDKGIKYGEEAVKLSRKIKNDLTLLNAIINLSVNYTSIKEYDKATRLLKEALPISRALKNTIAEATIFQNLGNIALEKYDIPETKKYIETSLAIFRKIGSADGEAVSLRGLALCYLQEKNYAKAKEVAEQALVIDKKFSYRREEAFIRRLLSCIYYAAGDVKNGYTFDSESNDILEKMIKEILSEQSGNLEKKYETAKKDNQIKLQMAEIERKNTLNYILIGSALTILIISLLSYRTYQQKKKIQQQLINELETEKQLTATEAVLKGEEQERTRLAKDLHDGLGGMLSGIKYSLNTMKGNLIMTPDNAQAFERSMDMLDSSIQEMRRVAHNMMPETLVKYGLDTALKDFCNDVTQSGILNVAYRSIGLDDAVIKQTTAITIYRIVQELLNNTMKHAAASKAIVQVSRTNGLLSVTVEDDGKGFDTAILNKVKARQDGSAVRGIGWENIKNRVDFLKGKLDVNSQQGKGTSVHIEFNS